MALHTSMLRKKKAKFEKKEKKKENKDNRIKFKIDNIDSWNREVKKYKNRNAIFC